MPSSPKLLAGRYMLYGEIGAGGMATVHLGRLVGTAGFSRTIAIKRLMPDFARDEQFVAMIVDEARLAARIRHPNVVPILDCVAEDGELFLVMEYVAGDSLARIVKATTVQGSKVPPRIASSIIAGALYGLHNAHEAKDELGAPLGIVHRDVSPQNILVGVDGVARVIDFGIAKAAGRLQTTRRGTVKGKVAYMPPEQISGKTVDRKADVYAAAVVLWETLTCERLFEVDGDVDAVVAGRVLQRVVAPPSSRAPGISSALDAVVMRGLDRDPTGRFDSAQQMVLALEAACPPATASEVGAWVNNTVGPTIAELARHVAQVESASAISRALQSSPPPAAPADDARDVTRRVTTQPMPLEATAYKSTELAPRKRGSAPPGVSRSGPPPLPPSASAAPPPVAPDAPDPLVVPAPLPLPPPLPAPVPGPSPGPAGQRPWGRAIGLATLAGVLLAALGTAAYLRLSHGGEPTGGAPAGSAGGTVTSAKGPALPSAVVASAAPACPAGMVPVPGGKFFMGSDEKDASDLEKPAHKVILAPYCMDRFEVTVKEYVACTARNACKPASATNEGWGHDLLARERAAYDPVCNIRDPEGRADHPINCVDWTMADAFCRAEGRRLPTEAEWEFAARGPDGRRYPWGDDPPTAKRLNACGPECVAWGKEHKAEGDTSPAMYEDSDGFATTAPVGSFPDGRSPYGVEDVVGNVWEWVSDLYAPYGPEDGGPIPEQTDPKGPAVGNGHVIRGGGWNGTQPGWVRPTFRYHADPLMRSHGYGFRCAKTL